ncbi:uncharacterized protein [Battus philenor]|uniref:uncharacterized protein n=1 Tax=Battus philenor TaxID=42288 RepID=UPI0035CF19EC
MDFDYKKIVQSYQLNPNNLSKFSLNIFDEYEYIYDDERYQTSGGDYTYIAPEELQSGRKHKQKIHRKGKKSKLGKVKLNLLDYYSLEPASAYVNVDDNRLVSDDGNVWYVPQDLPCWQLPLLYGELGHREKSNVFSINRGYLKNVVHHRKKQKFFSEIVHTPEMQMYNKWCGIEPCYGDHTLCLFPDKTISNFCENGYTVKTPTSSEQVALVNTVNSMRNRIAIGESIRYSHLPQAANMMQVTYDYDLEKMAYAWLSQCLPGPAPCSALDGSFVSQLECKKYSQQCCVDSSKSVMKCTPLPECFIIPIVGCIHTWYWSAGERLSESDIKCGHIEASTFNTVQLIWANTHKIGCALGVSQNGDVRVVCNFSPGARYFIKRTFYCGLLPHRDISEYVDTSVDITNLTFLSSLGINMDEVSPLKTNNISKIFNFNNHPRNDKGSSKNLPHWGVESLSRTYTEGWAPALLGKRINGTVGMLARLVTKFKFYEESQARCDTEEPIYVKGKPGALCLENGRRYPALCYHFGDPTPGYRLVAILAPITLFSLILYDLFSGAVRQTIH